MFGISIKSSSAVTVSDFYPAQENSLVYYNDESCDGEGFVRFGTMPKNILNLQYIPSFPMEDFQVSSLRCIIIHQYRANKNQ